MAIYKHNFIGDKLAYCQLINRDLLKLNTNQLYKVLVLVKNTAEENEKKETGVVGNKIDKTPETAKV